MGSYCWVLSHTINQNSQNSLLWPWLVILPLENDDNIDYDDDDDDDDSDNDDDNNYDDDDNNDYDESWLACQD